MIFLGRGPGLLAMSPSTAKEFLNKTWPLSARFLHIAIGGTAVFGILLYFAGDFGSQTGYAGIFWMQASLSGCWQ
jgi:hypothetical protein